eukprot:5697080-Amphidinium_carterae.1
MANSYGVEACTRKLALARAEKKHEELASVNDIMRFKGVKSTPPAFAPHVWHSEVTLLSNCFGTSWNRVEVTTWIGPNHCS